MAENIQGANLIGTTVKKIIIVEDVNTGMESIIEDIMRRAREADQKRFDELEAKQRYQQQEIERLKNLNGQPVSVISSSTQPLHSFASNSISTADGINPQFLNHNNNYSKLCNEIGIDEATGGVNEAARGVNIVEEMDWAPSS